MKFFEWARRYRIVISALIGALLIYLSQPTGWTIGLGLPLVLLGEGLRTWSSGHIRKNKALATDGPYAHTRNPLYLGSFLIGSGFVVMGNSPWVLLVFGAAFGLIYWGVIRSEERDLAQAFGKDFDRYVQTVPRFIPKLSRAPYSKGGFDWNLVLKHRENRAWLGLAAGVAVLAWKAWAA